MILYRRDYPEKIKKWGFFPEKIYYEGNINFLSKKTIGIVGTRRPNKYSKLVTENIVEKFYNRDIVIISGFANGIDYYAHLAAKKFNLPTVAVLGCGIDVDYPKNRNLLRKYIYRNGLFLSTYDYGVLPKPHHFPVRNRYLAAICDVIIVVRCSIKSGTMITAKYAADLGVDLWSVPSDIFDEGSEGSNYLINMGANSLYNLSLLDDI